MEQEVGISVCWVSFSLKNKELSTEDQDELTITKILNINFPGDPPVNGVQEMC